jgi:murein L,D-transpeptidase YcbB/YkuD
MKRTVIAAGAAGLIAVATAGAAQAQIGAPNIGLGFHNNVHAVWCVQDILNQTDNAGLNEDGDFGYATEGAVEAFQDEHQLPPDGIVGRQTGRMLLNTLALKRHTTVWDSYCRQYIPT